ncbi:unnamed protein product [Peniophora sp. CBMAI 1063]|nr:unnamed protein product [Peniophora sp. CBMAI 1063]
MTVPPPSPQSVVLCDLSDDMSLSSVPESSCSLGDGPFLDAPGTDGKKRGRYFYSADMLTFAVEDAVYRVHGYLFTRHSSHWASEAAQLDIFSEPHVLDDVTAREMEAFLSILYPSDLKGHDPSSVEEWSGVLRLATKWEFTSMRHIAITKLGRLASPLEKLIFGRAMDVPDWIVPALVALCARSEMLSLDEARQLSLEDVLRITSVREDAWRNPDPSFAPSQTAIADRLQTRGPPSHLSPPLPTSPRAPSPAPSSAAAPVLGPAGAAPAPIMATHASEAPPKSKPGAIIPDSSHGNESQLQLSSEEPPIPLMSPAELQQTLQRLMNLDQDYEEAARLLQDSSVSAFSQFLLDGSKSTPGSGQQNALTLWRFLNAALNRAVSRSSTDISKTVTALVKTICNELQTRTADMQSRPRKTFSFQSTSQGQLHNMLRTIFICVGQFWRDVEQACAAYGNFGLGYASVALKTCPCKRSETPGSAGFAMTHQEIAYIIAIRDVAKSERRTNMAREAYNQRCAKLHELLVSFADAQNLTEAVPSFLPCPIQGY